MNWKGSRARLTVAVLLAVLLVGGALAWTLWPTEGRGWAPAITVTQANSLSAALTSGSDSGLASALVMPTGQQLDPSAANAFAAMAPIAFDVSSFHEIDATDATITGTVAHPVANNGATWTFDLSYANGTWKITDAEPKP